MLLPLKTRIQDLTQNRGPGHWSGKPRPPSLPGWLKSLLVASETLNKSLAHYSFRDRTTQTKSPKSHPGRDMHAIMLLHFRETNAQLD